MRRSDRNSSTSSAADAVAASVLARPESSTLAIFGATHQALFECLALSRLFKLQQILVVTRDHIKAETFAEQLRRHDLPAMASNARDACREADIVVTATPSRTPLFDDAFIKPGTHISCMGADSKGKQEIPVSLLDRASLFCDLPSQSCVIGEFQHARPSSKLVPIGVVLQGDEPGRHDNDEITIFDSSGIALQDLFVAQRLAHAARS